MAIDVFFSNIQSLATFIGAVTVIGGFLITLYKYIIQNPLEKRRERQEVENQRLTQKAIMDSLQPLNETVQLLNDSMEERARHDAKLDQVAEQNGQILKKHDERLDNHNERLIVLEVRNGVRKPAKYVEDEKGGE